ncbi:hypothetical protein E4T56_gene11277 [Termitomyces sp. T112]|nr:hypothetical protein E4T56_gene11277 [Termitomyces sp. T112]
MDSYSRSQSVLQAHPGGTALPSRATRVLQKITGRLRFHPSRKPVPTTKDDSDPYPSRAAFLPSISGIKPYMSHPVLNSTLIKPYEPGYEQDSPTQSASPSGSMFRGPIDQRKRSGNDTAHPIPETLAAAAATTPQAIDELQLSFVQEEPFMWNNDNQKPHVRPPRLIRPATDIPTLNHHRPSMSRSDAVGPTLSSSTNSTGQSATLPRGPSQTMTSPKQSKSETPSTFSPTQFFTRKVSRQNLHDAISRKKSTNNLQNTTASPSHLSKHYHTSPSTIISDAFDSPAEIPASSPGAKRPKPTKIDTNFSPARFFTRKPSRLQLQESHSKRRPGDPLTPHADGQHDWNIPPSPPPPLPKIFPIRSKIATLSPPTSSFAASTPSYYTIASIPTSTDATTNTTPASTSMTKPSASPLTHIPARITTTASASAIPTSPPPPILQRSETAPHSYRLSFRLSGTSFLRPPPLPLLNLPTLPPSSPLTSTPQRFCLKDVPQLSHDGGSRDPDEVEDDMDEDEEGRMSRSSSRVTAFIDHDHEDEDGDGDEYRPPSSNGSTADLSITTTSSSFNTSLGGGRKTHSRSSSYNHSTLSHSISLETSVSTSFTHGAGSSSSNFLSLPGPDMSRLDLDLSFLDREPSPPPSEVIVPQSWSGKAGARPEDDDRDYAEEGGKTPTIGKIKIGGYFDVSKPLPLRRDSLKLRTGPDILGGRIGKGKGKEKAWDEEIDTAKPQGPVAIQASASLGGPPPGTGTSVGLSLGLSGSGIYASKRASRSLHDLGAAERREKVNEIVRDEEERKMERRKSQLTQVEGDGGREMILMAPKLRIDTQLAVGQERRKRVEEGEREETRPERGAGETSNPNGEATPSGLATPRQDLNKRFSRAPPYESVIRKRRSLPMFIEASNPPPYPAFPPLSSSHLDNITPFRLYDQAGPSIEPRDDEGRERLPPYSNALYMRAILSRKMEFISAGVQARDRKWRRVVCVLEGTALKVYKAPREHTGKGMFGEWWERKVGVGDVSTPAAPAVQHKKGDEVGTRERISKLYGEGFDPAGRTELELRPPPTPITPITPERTQPRLTGEHPFIPGQSSIYGNAQPQANRSRLNLAVSSLLKPSSHSRSRSHGRVNGDVAHLNVHENWNPLLLYNSGAAGSSVGDVDRGSFSSRRPGSSLAHSHAPSVSSAHSPTPSIAAHAIDNPKDLLRMYTMQNAESGLGNDYIKRKNVIRVRAEGEQFLLQAKDVADVVTWIEVLQASANIALDLDERLMPKGPLFPRRRRRRPRQTTGTGAGATTGSGTSMSAAVTATTHNIVASATAQIVVPL